MQTPKFTDALKYLFLFNWHVTSMRLDHYLYLANNIKDQSNAGSVFVLNIDNLNLTFNLLFNIIYFSLTMIIKPNYFQKLQYCLTKSQPILNLRVWCLPLNKGVEARNETLEYMQTVVLEVLSQSHHKHSRCKIVPSLFLCYHFCIAGWCWRKKIHAIRTACSYACQNTQNRRY